MKAREKRRRRQVRLVRQRARRRSAAEILRGLYEPLPVDLLSPPPLRLVRKAADAAYDDAGVFEKRRRPWVPASEALRAKLAELNAVIDEQHRQLGAMRIAVPSEGT